MISMASLQELSCWRKRLEEKYATVELDRLEQADLDFLNDMLPCFEVERVAP